MFDALNFTAYPYTGEGIGRRHHDLALIEAGADATYGDLVVWMKAEIGIGGAHMRQVCDRAVELLGSGHDLVGEAAQDGQPDTGRVGVAFAEARNDEVIVGAQS